MMKFPNILYSVIVFFLLVHTQAGESYGRVEIDPDSSSYVEVQGHFSELPSRGFMPVRVTLANRTKIPMFVKLSFENTSGTGISYRSRDSGLHINSEFTINGEAEHVTTQDLLVPVAPVLATSSWSIDTVQNLSLKMLGSNGIVNSYSKTTSLSTGFPNILLSEDLFVKRASALDADLDAHLAKLHAVSYSSAKPRFAGSFVSSVMSEDWRAYSGYDLVMLSSSEYTALSPGVKSALAQWIHLGGRMYIIADSATDTLSSLGIKESNEGMGSIELWNKNNFLSGSYNVISMLVDKKYSSSNVASASQDYATTLWDVASRLGSKSFNPIFFLAMLLIFGIIVGPVNLFYFAKSGRRHRLFFTTPIISLIASIVLIISIFFVDGFGGKGNRNQLMEVNQNGTQTNAYIHQEQLARTGVLIGNHFFVNDSCVLTPVLTSSTPWSRLSDQTTNAQKFSVMKDGNQTHFAGDWFQSRSEHAQTLDVITPTRGGIEIVNAENGGKQFVSRFEFPIEKLMYQDDTGNFYVLENLQSGVPLLAHTASEANYLDFTNSCTRYFAEKNQHYLYKLSLRKNHYIAYTQSAPAHDTFKKIHWNDTMTVITGNISATTNP